MAGGGEQLGRQCLGLQGWGGTQVERVERAPRVVIDNESVDPEVLSSIDEAAAGGQ
jgi:hypothetical protein